MPVDGPVIHLHLVSDSTGETVLNLAHAAIAQFDFDDLRVQEHVWPLIRTQAQLEKVLSQLNDQPGIILYTMVDETLRSQLASYCQSRSYPSLSVLDPVIALFSQQLGRRGKGRPGLQHEMDAGYFARIDAMQFTLAHDDGQGDATRHQADVVVLGVSRTSKTPTCMYLANRGLKAANIPFVPGVRFSEAGLSAEAGMPGPLVVGLYRDWQSLVEIRQNRLKMIRAEDISPYVEPEIVKRELAEFRRLCTQRRWQTIDVSRRSIEETAAAIIAMLEKRHDSPKASAS